MVVSRTGISSSASRIPRASVSARVCSTPRFFAGFRIVAFTCFRTDS